MGEVNDMKKVISVVMCAVMLLCCACFAGCSSQSSKQTDGNVIKAEGGTQTDGNVIKAEDIQKTLVNAGFTEAYIPEKDASLADDLKSIYLDKNKTGYITNGSLGEKGCLRFRFYESRDDIPEILDIVIPLYDKSFVQGDGEEILKKLKSKRVVYRDGKINGGRVSFKNLEYKEFLDKGNTFTESISISYL